MDTSDDPMEASCLRNASPTELHAPGTVGSEKDALRAPSGRFDAEVSTTTLPLTSNTSATRFSLMMLASLSTTLANSDTASHQRGRSTSVPPMILDTSTRRSKMEDIWPMLLLAICTDSSTPGRLRSRDMLCSSSPGQMLACTISLESITISERVARSERAWARALACMLSAGLSAAPMPPWPAEAFEAAVTHSAPVLFTPAACAGLSGAWLRLGSWSAGTTASSASMRLRHRATTEWPATGWDCLRARVSRVQELLSATIAAASCAVAAPELCASAWLKRPQRVARDSVRRANRTSLSRSFCCAA
jgi:hypothetical protein